MKTRLKRISKSTLSVVLAICMLLSCMMVGMIPVDAGAGNTTGNWYISNSLQGTWDSDSAYQLTRSSATDYYRDFYFTKSDTSDLFFRFWGKTDNNKLGAYYGDGTEVPSSTSGTSKDHAGQGVWGWSNTWKFTPSSQLSTDNFYRVRIHLSPGGGYTGDYNEYNETRYFSGRTWYTATSLSSLSPKITTAKTSSGADTDTFTVGDTVYLSSTSSNNVGTVSYSYRYKLSGASSYTNAGTSFKPTSVGTYTVEVTATDGGVVTDGNTKNAFTDRTETTTKNITVKSAAYNINAVKKLQAYNVNTGSYNTTLSDGTDAGTAYADPNPVTPGKSAELKATANPGYTFVGWYSNEACTDKLNTYTVTPSGDTTYYALFKQNEPEKATITVASVDNATVTITWGNNTYNEGDTPKIPIGATITVTVKPIEGYYVKEITPGASFTVEQDTTVSATIGKNSKIEVVTSDASLGTATATPEYAHSGETVTITVSETGGTFESISGRYSDGITFTPAEVTKGKSYKFNMEYDKGVTITVTFTEYSKPSDYYYNGYKANGADLTKIDKYFGQQMTEAKLDGVPYSYYKVSGRSGENFQTFTVSKGQIDPNSANSGYLYVETPWIYDWADTGTPRIYWNEYDTWGSFTELEFVKVLGKNESTQKEKKLWRTKINPDSECVIVNGGSGDGFKQTTNISKEAIKFGAIWIETTTKSEDNKNKYNWQKYSETDLNNLKNDYKDKAPGYTSSTGSYNGIEYICTEVDKGVYSDAGKTNGFYDYSNRCAWPKNASLGEYYIIVLYPGNTYTINDVEVKVPTGENPIVIWMENLPGAPVDNVKKVNIYAKNGALRETKFNRFTELADTEIVSIEDPDGNSLNANITKNKEGWNSNYDMATNIPVGSTITFKTTLTGNFLEETPFKDTHYVKGFVINGITYEIYKPNDSGEYTMTWTVEDINTEGTTGNNTIEITPVYYLKDNTNAKTFYVEGYAGKVESKWGNTPYVYPYYSGVANEKDNAFGGYAGQPMLYWGGKYQMEIPLTSDGTSSGKQIQGLTLSNGFFDELHKQIDGTCRTNGHRQTYDYDDFVKIFREKGDAAKTIYFWFKYRDKYDNFQEGGDARWSYDPADEKSFTKNDLVTIEKDRNGLEIMTDYYGNQVGMFSNPVYDGNETGYHYSNGSITGLNGKELLVISTGYKKTYMGEYSTMWAVYAQSNTANKGNFDTFIGYIPSSMLFLTSKNNVTKYTNGTSTKDGQLSYAPFIKTYDELKAKYTGRPVLISYEKEIKNSKDDVANRCDGRWMFSDGEQEITANIKIQYADSKTAPAIDNIGGTDGWKDDEFSKTETGAGGKYNVGSYTKTSAYFTNTTPRDLLGMTVAENIMVDNDKNFTFQAMANTNWKFVGWVRLNQNGEYSEITTNALGSSNMSANDTYIARFIKPQDGTLVIRHNTGQITGYMGNGTPTLDITIKDGSGNERKTYSVTNGSEVNVSTYIKEANNAYTIDIKLNVEPNVDCEYAYRTLNSEKIESEPQSTTHTYTVKQILEDKITQLFYRSYFTKTVYNYEYVVKYTYPSRFFGPQSFTVDGTIDDDAMVSGSGKNAKLTNDFLEDNTPYQSNFLKKITWDYSEENVKQKITDKGNNTILIEAEVKAAESDDNIMKAEINLPYRYVTDKVKNGKVTEYSNKAADPLPIYDANGNKTGKTDIAYDEDSYETFTITTPYGHLFEYNLDSNQKAADGTHGIDYYDLIEAAPYVLMDVKFHTTTVEKTTDYAGVYETPDGPLEVGKSYTDETTNTVYTQKSEDEYTAKYKVEVADGIIEGEYTKKYFSRWDIYTQDGEYVASSYHSKLNYCAYEDYYITPVYARNDPNESAYTNGPVSTTISYLGATRNQWNKGDAGTYTTTTGKTDAAYAGDKIFTDFAIAYEFYNDTQINKIPADTAKIEYGIIVENLGYLDGFDSKGNRTGKVDYNAGTYAEKYAESYGDNIESIEAYIKTKLDGKKPESQPTSDTKATQFVKIGSNQSENEKVLSTMNRIEFADTFTTMSQEANGAKINNANQHHYAYRVTSFISVNGNVVLSDPEYFTLYSVANR